MTIETYVLAMTVLWALTGIIGFPLSLYGWRHARMRLAAARRYKPYDPIMVILAAGKVRRQMISAVAFALMLVVLISAVALPIGGLRTGVNTTLVVLFGLLWLMISVLAEIELRQAERVNGHDTEQTQKEYDDLRHAKRDAAHDALNDPLRAAAFEAAKAAEVDLATDDAKDKKGGG